MTTSDTAPKRPASLRLGAVLELVFTDILASGQGVGRAGSVVVFCFGPLSGERARVRITEVKRNYAVATMLELLARSPERAQPFCPVFGACGGCQVQHLAYPAQLEWKRGIVRNALARIGGMTGADVLPTIGMRDPRAYRNKMAVVVDHATGSPVLGFYRQRSHEVVAIDACPIVTPPLDALLGRLAALRGTAEVDEMLTEARHLVARGSEASGRVVLTVTTDRPSPAVRRAAPMVLERVPALAGVTNSFDRSANAIAGRKQNVLAGDSYVDETIGGVRYRVSAGSFFQVNVEIVGRIFEFLDGRLPTPRNAVDLYCGIGTFALYFARRGWTVVGVEENRDAVAEAVANARRNGLAQRAAFVHGRVEEMARAGKLEPLLCGTEMAFLDPPRKGCDEVTLAALAHARPRRLWYLSCDAATLARDVKFLVSKGFGLAAVQPFDMFPQTGHVETLALLSS